MVNKLLRHAEPFDYAIPQPWANEVKKLTGMYPPGHIVWSYAADIGLIFGAPFPVDNYGALMLRLYENTY